MRIHFPNKLYRAQYDFVHAAGRHNLFSAGVGAGKSWALAYRAFYLAMNKPGSIGYLCMWTYPQLRDVMLPTLFKLLEHVPPEFWVWKKGDKEIHFANGSVWKIRNLESEFKARGPNLDYICIDELTAGVKEEVYDQLLARIRASPGASVNSATNPDSKAHWAYKRWYKDPQRGYKVYTMRTLDNKALPQDYLDDLQDRTETWKKQFLNGEWGALVGAVYSVEDGVHEVHRDSSGGRMFLSFDWGFKVDDWVCLLINLSDGHIHVVDEINCKKLRNSEIVPLVKQMLNRHGNPSLSGFSADSGGELAPPSIMFWQQELKIPFYASSKRRLQGWLAVMDMLESYSEGVPRLTFEKGSTPRTLESLRSLQWDEKKNDVKPGDDHNSDALRYFIKSQVMMPYL